MPHSETFLHDALEAVPSGAWTARADGTVDWVNATLVRYLGLGDRPWEDAWPRLVHPADWPRVDAAWKRAVETGTDYAANARLLEAGTGRYHWHLCRAHRLADASGRARWVGLNVDIDSSYRDIEVQQASLERLQVERSRLRSVFASCPVAITVYEGNDHRIAMMNAAGRRIVGGRNLEGQCLADAFPEIVSQGLVEIVDRVAATGETFEATEFPLEFDREGTGLMETGYFNFSLQALVDAEGRTYGVLSSAIDVTAQMRNREELARLAAEREAVLSQFEEGIVIADAQGRISFVNARASELHGLERLDVGPDDYAAAYSLLREDGSPYPSRDLPLARAVLHGETVRDARWIIRRPDGSDLVVQGNARPITGVQGERMGAVLTLRPVTG